jgi:hypothetical protein
MFSQRERRVAALVRIDHSPSDSVPGLVSHVEDEVLRVGVDWTGEHLGPVLEVGPRLVRVRAREGRVAGTEQAGDDDM